MTKDRERADDAAVPERDSNRGGGSADLSHASLRETLEQLARLSPQELLSQLDLRQAGADFARLIGCDRNIDCHLYSAADDGVFADNISTSENGFRREIENNEFDIGLIGSISDDGAPAYPEGLGEASDFGEFSGVVKWFDIGKGFGFIELDNGCEAVLLPLQVLQAGNIDRVLAGARIHFIATRQTDKWRAMKVLQIDNRCSELLASQILPAQNSAKFSPWLPAICTTFDKVRGRGELILQRDKSDVSVGKDVLRAAGFVAWHPGQMVDIRYLNDDDGGGRSVVDIRLQGAQSRPVN